MNKIKFETMFEMIFIKILSCWKHSHIIEQGRCLFYFIQKKTNVAK